MSRDIHAAEFSLNVCEDGHIHFHMRSVCDCGVECPDLGCTLEASDAREFAVKLLEAAASISPVS